MIFYSIAQQKTEITELLIKNGANLNLKCSEGYTHLDNAVIIKNQEIIKLLINNGAKFSEESLARVLFLGFVKKEDKDMVAFLIQNNPEFFKPLCSNLYINAIKNSDKSLIEHFIKNVLPINPNNGLGSL